MQASLVMRQPATIIPPITLDRDSAVPLQRQLYDAIRRRILDGTLKPETRLPSTREFASALNVSRNCVLNAYRFLVAQGLTYTRHGGGTRVASAPKRHLARATQVRNRRSALTAKRMTTDVSTGQSRPFSPGVGPVDIFPKRAWRSALARAWRAANAATLSYDAGNGDATLRQHIAAYLGVSYGIRCDKEQVIIVGGAQQAIDLSARVLLEPGDVTYVEDPGFPGAVSAFIAAGAQLIGVPVGNDGFDVAAARRLDTTPRLVYVTPSHQYPTGKTLSMSARSALLELAHSSGTWVIEDSFGGDFHEGAQPLPSLFSMDSTGSVVYIGSFSQMLAPALRVGYVVVPPDLIAPFTTARAVSGRGTSVIDQIALAAFMSSGDFARHLRVARGVCLERRRAMMDLLVGFTPEVVSVDGTAAGCHVVAYLRPGLDDIRVSMRARQLGIEAPALRSYTMSAQTAPALVLGYGSNAPDVLERAVAVLRRAFTS